MKRLLSILVLALPLLCTAQTVWRCGPDGRVYADTPCTEGRRLDVAQARPDSDVLAAQQQARQEIKHAEVLRRERLQQEAASRGNGLTAIGPRIPEVKPRLVVPKPHRKWQAAVPEAGGTWRSTQPSSRQKTG